MNITWYGLGCFRISERSHPTVVTSPFSTKEREYTLPHRKVEIVTLPTPQDDCRHIHWKGVHGQPHVFAGPGEYEVGGLFITAIGTYRDNKRGAQRGENIIYTFHINGFSLCHLGDLGHLPTQTQLETIGSIDIIFVPIGVPGGLTPTKASEVISMIEPHIVIPMHYKTPGLTVKRSPLERFLKEMGISKETSLPELSISASDIPEETEVMLLQPRK
ncbi:MAG: MBL fold metallo-hydrolase [Chloroflexota bacterium]|nr:MBL fold metallo-hydrolase [Chloroflexota bacterium]